MIKTYIPLNSIESAALKDPNTLLPKAVYKKLAEFIDDAVKQINSAPRDFNDSRSHKAISIDGERGTGKTSVLVNLEDYLGKNNKILLNDIHILDPIDPTLLEDGESLFLHIIVAAVLQDEKIKTAQMNRLDKSRNFSQSLEKLAAGLESIDLQNTLRGMDKIRSLYGNKHLANCVEAFFRTALELLDKKLFILPIDDVDASLNNAFENLEIIRRYLTSPYILPIVSGDRRLYDEVCWRDFHGRLIKDSAYNKKQAFEIAKNLALEYQRKILPLPRRLSMPAVSEYWIDKDIIVGNHEVEKNNIPLRNFIAWLTIFITGPVNGTENSKLQLPIRSIRALSQLISHCGLLIPQLPESILNATSLLEVRRYWQMPTTQQSIINKFNVKHQELSKEKKRFYSEAYKIFYDEFSASEVVDYSQFGISNSGEQITIADWVNKLADYFRFEPEAGAIYLILKAKQDWEGWKINQKESILSTLLFQPLNHEIRELDLFEKSEDLADWIIQLEKRLPERWLEGIKKQHTILPYPVVEIGINTALNWAYWDDIQHHNVSEDEKSRAILLISLLTERNFYTNAKQSILLNIGRIFELIIASLISPLELTAIEQIRQRAPFFSTSELAPTKTVDIDEESANTSSKYEDIKEMSEEVLTAMDESLLALHGEITQWYKDTHLSQLNISPWLVYKVFNKVYNQVANSTLERNGMKDIDRALNLIGRVFYATWSAFASFEKGELFGLPDVVATTNINSGRNFEMHDHYRINVGPFCPTKNQMSDNNNSDYLYKKTYGEQTRTVSYVLATHPLRRWIDSILAVNWQNKLASENTKIIPLNDDKVKTYSSSRAAIIGHLKLRDMKSLQYLTIKNALEKQKWTKERYEIFLKELNQKYPGENEINTYKRAGKEYFSEDNS